MTGAEALRANNAEFRKEIIRLDERCYLAVGYASSNVGMIIGDPAHAKSRRDLGEMLTHQLLENVDQSPHAKRRA